jgi:hypothetical protein
MAPRFPHDPDWPEPAEDPAKNRHRVIGDGFR